MSVHEVIHEEAVQEAYDKGYIAGYHSKENKSLDFQQGQVLMRTKCLQVIKKYYGSSVYDYLQKKINEIPLEE